MMNGLLTLAVRNSTLTQIVRCQLYGHAISGDDTDEMLPHLAGDMSYNLMPVFKLYSKLSPGEGLDDYTRQLDYFFTRGHKYNKVQL